MAAPLALSWSACCRSRALLASKKFSACAPPHAGCASVAVSSAGPSSTARHSIALPNRKQRHSLSILEALATTVTRDPNAPDYRYLDDPYLIPVNGYEKRMFALSKASGQNAAQFAVKSWPHLFANDPSEPKVKAFQPDHLPYVHIKVSEEALLERIAREKTLDAIDMYEKLKAEGGSVSLDTKKRLLELACINNGQDPLRQITRDENWFRENFFKDYVKHAKTWREDSFAEKLFQEFAEKDADVYTAMILGLAKYYDVEKAWTLYEEARAKAVPLRTEVYNAVLDIAFYLKDTYDSRYELALMILKTMDDEGVLPNLFTFNAILNLLSRINRYRAARQYALETLNEMKACRIEPSLGTWHYILQVFYPRSSRDQSDKGVLIQDGQVLHDVLGELKGRQFHYRHEADLRFFTGAMLIAASQRDLEAAYKIDALHNEGRNFALSGDAVLTNNYYTFFFKLVAEVEPLDKVMAMYRKLVPNIWVSGYAGMELLLSTVELYEGYQYLPEVWSSIVSLDIASRTNISTSLMKLMAAKKNDSVVQNGLVLLTDRIRLYVLEAEEAKRTTRLVLNGEMYGYLIMTCLNGGDFNRAWAMMPHLKKAVGAQDRPSEACLVALTQACIENGDTAKALECAALAKDLALPLETLSLKLMKHASETGNEALKQDLRSRI